MPALTVPCLPPHCLQPKYPSLTTPSTGSKGSGIVTAKSSAHANRACRWVLALLAGAALALAPL